MATQKFSLTNTEWTLIGTGAMDLQIEELKSWLNKKVYLYFSTSQPSITNTAYHILDSNSIYQYRGADNVYARSLDSSMLLNATMNTGNENSFSGEGLQITYDDIANCPVQPPDSVTGWNTYLSIDVVESATVKGDTITLKCSGFIYKAPLYNYNSTAADWRDGYIEPLFPPENEHLIRFVDEAGYIKSIIGDTGGVLKLKEFKLNGVTDASAFYPPNATISLSAKNAKSASLSAYTEAPNWIRELDFPNMESTACLGYMSLSYPPEADKKFWLERHFNFNKLIHGKYIFDKLDVANPSSKEWIYPSFIAKELESSPYKFLNGNGSNNWWEVVVPSLQFAGAYSFFNSLKDGFYVYAPKLKHSHQESWNIPAGYSGTVYTNKHYATTNPSFVAMRDSHPNVNVIYCDEDIATQTTTTADLTSTATTGATMRVDGKTSFDLVLTLGTATTAPSLKLQVSYDGTNWQTLDLELIGVANDTKSITIDGIKPLFARWKVSTAGATIGTGYKITLRGK